MQKKVSKLISILLCAIMVLGIMPVTSFAADELTVRLTQSDLETIITESDNGDGWSYNADSKTLTLDNWSGQRIDATGSITIYLKGENTITMKEPATGDYAYGIGAQAPGSSSYIRLRINADDDAILNIVGKELAKRTVCASRSDLNVYGGKINVDIDTNVNVNSTVYGANIFAYNNTEVNVNVKSTTAGEVSGLWSYGAYGDGNKATINVTGGNRSRIYGIRYLYIGQSTSPCNPEITVNVLSGGEAATYAPTAYHVTTNNGLKGGFIESHGGYVCYGSSLNDTPLSPCTTAVLPENNDIIFKMFSYDEANEKRIWSTYFYMNDKDYNLVTDCKLVGGTTKTELKFVDESPVVIPYCNIGQSVYVPFSGSLRGLKKADIAFEILSGTLPKGLNIKSANDANTAIYVTGWPSEVTGAGECTVKIYDKTEPTRFVTKVIKWEGVIEADRFITVDGTKFEFRTDASGTGWSYSKDNKTLTLDGYNGGPINSEIGFNILLKNENTITINDTADGDYACGIYVKDPNLNTMVDVNVNAEDGAILNIVGNELAKKTVCGSNANLKVYGGKINVDIDTNNAINSNVYALWIYAYNNAEVNVKVKSTTAGEVTGLGSYGAYGDGNKATVNVTGGDYSNVYGINNMYVGQWSTSSCNPEITVNVSGGEAATYAPTAYYVTTNHGLKGGFIESHGGYVYYSYTLCDCPLSPYTVAEIPADNNIIFKNYSVDESNEKRIRPDYFYIHDKDYNLVKDCKLVGGTTKIDLKFVDENPIVLPDSNVGDRVFASIAGSLRGLKKADIAFEIVSGTLPKGLQIKSEQDSWSALYVTGYPSEPAEAGQCTVKIYDTNDETRFATKVVKWNEIQYSVRVESVVPEKTEVKMLPKATETISVSVTPDNASYPYIAVGSSDENVVKATISDPNDDGISTLTLTSVNPGTATITLESRDSYVKSTVKVVVAEAAPNATIDYVAEELKGLVASAKYLIDGTEYTADANGKIAIVSDLLGKTVDIIKMGATAETNSAPQSLEIPARPAAPTATIENASVPEKADGKLNDVDSSMEYRLKGSDTWIPIYNSPVAVGIGEYEIRVRATNSNFVSESQLVTVAANHKHTIVKVLPKMSTCTEYGWTSIHYKCSECGQLFFDEAATMPIDYAPGRIAPTHDLISATCTEPMKCKNCDYTEGTALGHDLTDVSAKAATCTEDGHKAYKKCSRCDYTEGFEKIKAFGHKIVDVPGKVATCTEKGLSDGKKCSVCGEISLKQVETPTIGHDYKEVITKPTCTEGGFTTRTCKNCGHVVKDDETPARGHTPSDWLVKTEAKIGVKGEEIKKCTVCGVELESREIPAIEKPTTKPTEPTTKPTEPTTKPTEPTTKPTEPTTKPTEPTEKPTDPIANFLLGDVNGDGLVKANDARTALRAAAKLEELDERALKAADIDGNGKVSAAEARKILRFAAKLDKELK